MLVRRDRLKSIKKGFIMVEQQPLIKTAGISSGPIPEEFFNNFLLFSISLTVMSKNVSSIESIFLNSLIKDLYSV